eukprot:COSAG02_NODE_1496_length_12308_cov_6.264313_2_plen_201_part_00
MNEVSFYRSQSLLVFSAPRATWPQTRRLSSPSPVSTHTRTAASNEQPPVPAACTRILRTDLRNPCRFCRQPLLSRVLSQRSCTDHRPQSLLHLPSLSLFNLPTFNARRHSVVPSKLRVGATGYRPEAPAGKLLPHHILYELLIVDLAAAIYISLRHHGIRLLRAELFTNARHHVLQVSARDLAATVGIKNFERVDDLQRP